MGQPVKAQGPAERAMQLGYAVVVKLDPRTERLFGATTPGLTGAVVGY